MCVVTGLHDVDEYIQAQLLLAVSKFDSILTGERFSVVEQISIVALRIIQMLLCYTVRMCCVISFHSRIKATKQYN